MTAPSVPVKSILSRVELTSRGDKTNMVLTLTGNIRQLAADHGKLSAQEYKDKVGTLFVERGTDNASITITASITPDAQETSMEKKAGNVVEAVHNITGCRLSGIKLTAEAIPVVKGQAKTPYSAAVTIEPVVDRADSANRVGTYSMELIRRKHRSGNGIVCDPRMIGNTVSFLNIAQHFENRHHAMDHADAMLNKLESDFALYKKPPNLFLTSISNTPLNDELRRKTGLIAGLQKNGIPLTLTKATLSGPENEITKAAQALQSSFRDPTVFKQMRRGNKLNVMLCGDDYTDPARLLSEIHGKTRCGLPLDINATTIADSRYPSGHQPCLETKVWDEVPTMHHGATGSAFAHYVGMQIPGSDIFIPERSRPSLEAAPSRIVLNRHCASETEARRVAEEIKARVTARLLRGDNPRHL